MDSLLGEILGAVFDGILSMLWPNNAKDKITEEQMAAKNEKVRARYFAMQERLAAQRLRKSKRASKRG